MIALTDETEQLARLLAERSGKTPTEIIRQALEARALANGIAFTAKPRRKPSFDRMMEISNRCSRRPVLDDRSPDEIIGYDEFGLPR